MTAWVCMDCLFAREGELESEPDREPWGLIDNDDSIESVTLGLLAHLHECGLPEDRCCDVECECDRLTFSRHPCDGCGSTLAGHRQAYTLWIAS